MIFNTMGLGMKLKEKLYIEKRGAKIEFQRTITIKVK